MDFIRGAFGQIYDWCLQGVAFMRQQVFGLRRQQPLQRAGGGDPHDMRAEEGYIPGDEFDGDGLLEQVPPEDDSWRVAHQLEQRTVVLRAQASELKRQNENERRRNVCYEKLVAEKAAEHDYGDD